MARRSHRNPIWAIALVAAFSVMILGCSWQISQGNVLLVKLKASVLGFKIDAEVRFK